MVARNHRRRTRRVDDRPSTNEIDDIVRARKRIVERIRWQYSLSKNWTRYEIKAMKVFLVKSDGELDDWGLRFHGNVVIPRKTSFKPILGYGKYSFNLSLGNHAIRRLDTARHKNPDGKTLKPPHKHWYTEEYDDKFAYEPTTDQLPGNRDDPNQMCKSFLDECHIEYVRYVPLDVTDLRRFFNQ